MTNPTTQRRLTALLIGAIYRIANSLLPVIDVIANRPDRPWQQRATLAARFSRILQELLALTARIRPESLSRNPTFPNAPARPGPASPGPRATLHPAARPPAPTPARLFSARRLAQRLETLLRQLEQLAAEIGETLSASIRRQVARARAVAGCNALPGLTPPAPHPSWESTG